MGSNETSNQMTRAALYSRLEGNLGQYADAIVDFAPTYEQVLRDIYAENLATGTLRDKPPQIEKSQAMQVAFHQFLKDPRLEDIEDIHRMNVHAKRNGIPPIQHDPEMTALFKNVAEERGLDGEKLKYAVIYASQYAVSTKGMDHTQVSTRADYNFIAIETNRFPRVYEDINKRVAAEFSQKKSLEGLFGTVSESD